MSCASSGPTTSDPNTYSSTLTCTPSSGMRKSWPGATSRTWICRQPRNWYPPWTTSHGFSGPPRTSSTATPTPRPATGHRHFCSLQKYLGARHAVPLRPSPPAPLPLGEGRPWERGDPRAGEGDLPQVLQSFRRSFYSLIYILFSVGQGYKSRLKLGRGQVYSPLQHSVEIAAVAGGVRLLYLGQRLYWPRGEKASEHGANPVDGG